MTSEERDIVQELVVTPQHREPTISMADFIRRFPRAINNDRLAPALLEEAEREKSAEDLQSSLIIGFRFGFDPQQIQILCRFLDADWHVSHEDVVSALEELRSPEAVNALYRATQWVPEYLGYDDSRALAVKAIWALGKLPHHEAECALRKLAASEESVIRDAALQQLDRRKT